MSLRKILELAEYADKEKHAVGELARSTLDAAADVVVINKDDGTFCSAKVTDPDELLEGGFLRHIASDETLDRQGDIVSAKGWELDNYLKNPVILWAHSHSQPPVGKCVEIGVNRKKLIGIGEYPSASMYEFGNTAFRLAALGYMRAVSVGFMPTKFELLDEEDPWGGVRVLEQELWEYSVVPVPANPNALTLAAKGVIGYDVVRRWAEEVLDTREPEPVPLVTFGEVIRTAVQPTEKFLDAFKELAGHPLTLNISFPESTDEEAEESAPIVEEDEDMRDGRDGKEKEVFLGDTRCHEEETGIGIRIVDQNDPVIFAIVDEPTFDVDQVAMQQMIADSLNRHRGRLIDTDFMEDN